MANRVISIEVGKSITRAVEIDFKAKNPKIYSCFSFETPEGVLDDGLIRPDENFVNVMRGAMKHFRVKTKKVVFTISSGRIVNREVTIPLMKENKIAAMLAANSKEYFPVDLTDHQLLHRIVEKVDTQEDKHYKLSVLAVPNELIKSYERLARECNLTIVGLDYVGNSIGQFMNKATEEDGTITIKVDEATSMITIMKNGKIDLQRNIAYGIEDAVETMIETNVFGENLTYADALQIMRRKTCIRRHLDVEMDYAEEEDTDQAITNARIEITESLRMMIGNIGRVLDYYISRNADADIKYIKLIGLGADCSGLSKLMTNELGIKVTAFQEYAGVTFDKGLDDTGFKIAEYVSCIGAAIAPMSFQLGKGEEGAEAENESLLMPLVVFGVCALASVIMIGFTMIKMASLEAEKEEHNQRITELYPAKQTYEACNAALAELQSCQAMYTLTKSPVDKTLDFIGEMEANMPADLKINSLAINSLSITMNLQVSSKESMAELLIQLREFESVSSVSCGSIAQSEDEFGNKTVSATVVCTFSTTAAE